jgi:CDP-6-deoxy-D-xylo-4-hexulose-3-dehydrase
MRVPLASSGLREKDIAAAIETLNSGNLTMGKKVKEFENAMANFLGTEYFVMMNSGSSANLAIFEALMRPSKDKPRLIAGDGVLVPAIAWPTTIWPIVQFGLRPIFTDVEPGTVSLDLIEAQKLVDLNPNSIKAIFPIHPLGYALDSNQLRNFSEKNDLVLINDVCESLGSWRNGKHAGTTGLASSYSFYFSHHITTMEGGGVATDSLEFADDLRAIRSHGWSRDRSDVELWNAGVSQTDSKFLFVTTGFNIRPMEVQAAIGLLQIADINDFVHKRRFIAKKVKEAVDGGCLEIIDCGTLSGDVNEESHSWMLIGLRIRGENIRSRVLEKLTCEEIETRPILTGNFLAQPAMNRIDGNHPPASDFPNASEISESCFMVGAHHDLTTQQIEHLTCTLHEISHNLVI